MKQNTSQTLYPAFGFLIVIVVAIAAVATAVYQRNYGALAPNAGEQTQADYTVNSCRLDFIAERTQASPTPTPTCVPTNNLVDVSISLDVSGSMVGDNPDQTNSKLAKAKAAIATFTNQTLSDDPAIAGKVRLGLSRFGTCNGPMDDRPNNSGIVWPQTLVLSNLVTNTGRAQLLNRLNAITIPYADSNGTPIWDLNRTCTHEGIQLANQVLNVSRTGGQPRKYLIVVTDGRPFSQKFKNNLELMDEAAVATNSAILNNRTTAGTQIITVGIGLDGDTNPGFGNLLRCMAGELDTWTIYKRTQGEVSNDIYKVVDCVGNSKRINPGKYYLAQEPDDIGPVFQEIYEYITANQCLPTRPTPVSTPSINTFSR